jgi:hypothetical protein
MHTKTEANSQVVKYGSRLGVRVPAGTKAVIQLGSQHPNAPNNCICVT